MKAMSLTGAVALVTGADAVLGGVTALRLAGEGAAVVLTGRDPGDAEEAASKINELGSTAYAIGGDVADPDEAATIVEKTLDRFGRLDVLVNAVHLRVLGTALHASVEDWDAMLTLNIGAMLHVTHAAVPYLIAAAASSVRGVADIVNVGATDCDAVIPATSVYRLTQVALDGFSESLRHELSVEGVRVGTVQADHVHGERASKAETLISAEFVRPLLDYVEPVRRPMSDVVADAITYVVTRPSGAAVGHIRIHAARPTS